MNETIFDLETDASDAGAAERIGISRREFLQVLRRPSAATLGLPASAEAAIAKAVASAQRPSVIWLHFQECTGCTESLLRAEHPTLDKLILDLDLARLPRDAVRRRRPPGRGRAARRR
ncbi:MAG: hypothetical protein MZV65_33670 [Chromatiales bacterium]|nr:hypothetical protein [Chromatiales bacterium]